MIYKIIEVENLGLKFHIASISSVFRRIFARSNPVSSDFWAFRNISFSLKKGESLAIIGRNGSGKSTLLRAIAGIYTPDEGRCIVRGTIGFLQLGLGFHQELTGRDNIYISAAILGLKKSEIDRLYDDIVEFSELGEFINMPVKTYSSGMSARLGFSISMNLKPDILLMDEVMAVGDQDFKIKCKQKIIEFKESGRTIIYVSHSMREVASLCERALILDRGRVIYDGTSTEAIEIYTGRVGRKRRRKKALREISDNIKMKDI